MKTGFFPSPYLGIRFAILQVMNSWNPSATLPLMSSSASASADAQTSAASQVRITALDEVRGLAVSLMILSHGVKGLLSFDQFPSWGLVPIHLITKFSSTLFITTFGISLAVAYLPYAGTEKWPEKRTKLLIRGLVILFWYKILTIVEMFSQYGRIEILEALTYQRFPSYVEILGFYGLAFLWLPWFLPVWKKMPLWSKFALPLGTLGLSMYLRRYVDFGSHSVFEALLNEQESHYTWGQLARAPLVFTGLLMGEWLVRNYSSLRKRLWGAFTLLCAGAVFFAAFYALNFYDVMDAFESIALNEGKHPPEVSFMLFSISGSLLILSWALAGGERLAAWMKPFTIIGRDALQAFVFHIFVIFVFYRHLFDYWQKIPYTQALSLALLLIVMTSLWLQVRTWALKKSS